MLHCFHTASDNIINTPPEHDNQDCTDGWIYYKQACYKVETSALTWQQAEDSCQEKGASLASINSVPRNAMALLLSTPHVPVWIGLYKVR